MLATQCTEVHGIEAIIPLTNSYVYFTCNFVIKLNKPYLKLQFDYNSVGTNSLRIMGNELVTLHVIDLQTSEKKFPNHGTNIHFSRGQICGPMIVRELVSTE